MPKSDKRKNYIVLKQKAFDICTQMAQEGKTSEEIARYSGQSIRNAQRFVQRELDREGFENRTMRLNRRGPRPQPDEDLKIEVREILQADNSLTIRGALFI
jgi:hypothetical protein